MFSNGSSSSMSRAIVTPSLVIVGDAVLLVEDDVAALGPERDADGVGQAVDAALEAPPRHLIEKELLGHGVRCPFRVCGRLAGIGRHMRESRPDLRSAFDDRQDVLLADDEEILALDLELGAGVLRVQDLVARP